MISKSVASSNIHSSFSIPELVHIACSYQSRLTIRSDHSEYNAKSIMGMMSLNFADGTLLITGDGEDAQTAVEALAHYFTTGSVR